MISQSFLQLSGYKFRLAPVEKPPARNAVGEAREALMGPEARNVARRRVRVRRAILSIAPFEFSLGEFD